MHWFYSALLGFGPTVITTYLGIIAMRRGGNAKLPHWAASSLFEWLMPGLAFCSGTVLAAGEPDLGVSCTNAWLTSQMLVFYLINGHIRRLSLLKFDCDARVSWRYHLQWILSDLAPGVGFGFYVLFAAAGKQDFFLAYPTVRHFLGMYLAFYISGRIMGMFGRSKRGDPRCELLPPCELNVHIRQIARECGVELQNVFILRKLPFKFSNAFALSADSVIFSEDLVLSLTRDEVDAVVAHELGHVDDKSLWDIGRALVILGCLAWLALIALADAKISVLPAGLHWLHYVKWILLFLVPHLAIRAHSRWRERRAEKTVTRVANVRAAISGQYKLHALTGIPPESPWWYAITSTHPGINERVTAYVAPHGLSQADIREIRDKALAELDGSVDHYELPTDDEPGPGLVERPNETRRHKALTVSFIVAGVLIMIAGVAATILHGQPLWIPVGLGLGFATILVPILVIERMAALRTQQMIGKALADKYPDESSEPLLLVDAIFTSDWSDQKWQGAWIGTRDGKLIVLGEMRRDEIDLSGKITVEKWTVQGSASSSNGLVAVRYEVDTVPQWFAIKILGHPAKGLPRSNRQLYKHIRTMLANAGADLDKRKEEKRLIGLTLIRSVVALAAMVAGLALVQVVIQTSHVLKNESFWPHFIVAVTMWPLLWTWVGRARAPKKHAAETQDKQPDADPDRCQSK